MIWIPPGARITVAPGASATRSMGRILIMSPSIRWPCKVARAATERLIGVEPSQDAATAAVDGKG